MPFFMDVHKKVDGLTAEAVEGAHARDLEVQQKYGVKYLHYWFNEADGTVFCLSEAPNKEAAIAVHREAHGLMADEIVEVKEGHQNDGCPGRPGDGAFEIVRKVYFDWEKNIEILSIERRIKYE